MNTQGTPLNERIVYINNHDSELNVNIATNMQRYDIRDSVGMDIQVTNGKGVPVQGQFTALVTDDSQVSPDSLGNNIINSFLFTADIKGTVEEPGWYFENDAPEKAEALDNLLLTQGWIGYDWNKVTDPQPPARKYEAEPEFVVKGKVTNLFNGPIKKTKVTLAQRKPFLAMDTLTDDKGRFIFRGDNFFPRDSAYYLTQATNKRGETFNVGVDVDEFTPPPFKKLTGQLIPWYVNTDTLRQNNAIAKTKQVKTAETFLGSGKLLNEVNIKAKKTIPGSANPYPSVQITFTLDEADMNASKKMTLFELLKARYALFKVPLLPNFKDKILAGDADKPPPSHYTITPPPPLIDYIYLLNNHLLILIIDGQGTSLDERDTYMNYITAEDVKGIEIVYRITPEKYDLAMTYVTTYSGKGKFLRHIPGRYVYKPDGFPTPKKFYSPRYTAENKNIGIGTDMRSTIYWEPDLITDTLGKAKLFFFSADKPAGYTVIVEGTDLNGNMGYIRKKIKITAKKPL